MKEEAEQAQPVSAREEGEYMQVLVGLVVVLAVIVLILLGIRFRWWRALEQLGGRVRSVL